MPSRSYFRVIAYAPPPSDQSGERNQKKKRSSFSGPHGKQKYLNTKPNIHDKQTNSLNKILCKLLPHKEKLCTHLVRRNLAYGILIRFSDCKEDSFPTKYFRIRRHGSIIKHVRLETQL